MSLIQNFPQRLLVSNCALQDFFETGYLPVYPTYPRSLAGLTQYTRAVTYHTCQPSLKYIFPQKSNVCDVVLVILSNVG